VCINSRGEYGHTSAGSHDPLREEGLKNFVRPKRVWVQICRGLYLGRPRHVRLIEVLPVNSGCPLRAGPSNSNSIRDKVKINRRVTGPRKISTFKRPGYVPKGNDNVTEKGNTPDVMAKSSGKTGLQKTWKRERGNQRVHPVRILPKRTIGRKGGHSVVFVSPGTG